MRRLICTFVVRIWQKQVFLSRDSFTFVCLQVPVQIQLLNCVDSLLSTSQTYITEAPATSQSIFNLLHTILALQQGDAISEKVGHLSCVNLTDLSYDVTSKSVIKPCIKNDNPLVD